MSLLIKNIQTIVRATNTPTLLRGAALRDMPTQDNGYILIEGDRIAAWGDMKDCPERADQVLDATGRMVLPGWCDSHTHLVYAGSREWEFIDRTQGVSYEEIAKKGGGILNSAKRLNDTPEERLLQAAHERLLEIVQQGTAAVEIKSGYGLTVEGELKMLRVIQQLKKISPIPIKASFLGAHALPLAYRENRAAYLQLILEQMLPVIAEEGLADYIDVFCEKGFYTVAETEQLLEAGHRYGLRAKIHTNQFNSLGGIELCVRERALSVDHLEVLTDAEIDCLSASSTIATLLPSASFFLNMHYPPARKLLEKDVAVALASDFNPGTSPSGKMAFVVTLACIYMKMLPEEAINAATINGAYALELEDQLGSISVGKLANLWISRPMESLAFIPYSFGSQVVETVIAGGKVL